MFAGTRLTYRSTGMLAAFVSINIAWGSVALAQQQVTQPARQTDGILLVVNDRHHCLLEVDPITGQVEATVPIGVNGHEITLSTDQRYGWIPIYGDAVIGEPGTAGSTIDVVNLHTRQVSTIDLGRPLRPHLGVFGPGGLFSVTAEEANAVLIIDPVTKAVVGEIPTGKPQTHALVISADGRRGYTANVDSGTVSVLDIPHRKLLSVIPVAKRVQRIAISHDGRYVFTSDWDAPRVAVIDTAKQKLIRWIEVTNVPFVALPTPDGQQLLVAEWNNDKGHLDLIDLATMKSVRSLELGAQPFGIYFHDGTAYINCLIAGTIERLSLATWTLDKPLRLTMGVDGMAWMDRRR
jgi:DNA-binding beta-propeller fold protein YncE